MNLKKHNATGELKHFGLNINRNPDPRAHVLGGGTPELPKITLQEDGQWDKFLPIYEPQFNELFDSAGCTVWGSLNAMEMYIKRITGVERNFAERFNYILAKITPPGADPHFVMEVIRDRGVIKQELLPLLPHMTYEQFRKPNPMSEEFLDEGMKFEYELRHMYLWTPGKRLSTVERVAILKDNLKYSPICISVTAWYKTVSGIYIDGGDPNTHWCVLFGWNQKGDAFYDPKLPEGWKVFDSYDQSVKIVAWDHNFEIAKRIYLEPNNYLPKLSIIEKIIKVIQQLLTQFIFSYKPVEPVKPTPEPIPVPTPPVEPPKPSTSLLESWAKAIETFENAPKSWNNPGAIRGVSGKFLQFATYAEGFAYLKNYLVRAATGKHGAYPKGGETTLIEFQNIYSPASDNNNPQAYASFVAKKLGVSLQEKIKNLI